jgi:uncharacterized protein YcnI
MRRVALTSASVLLAGAVVVANVGVNPRESAPGATETYTFSVPSERGLTTSSVVLDVPEGVTVTSVSAPEGAVHEEKKTGDRITEVTWTIEIAPGARAHLSLVAANPAAGAEIVWRVHDYSTLMRPRII